MKILLKFIPVLLVEFLICSFIRWDFQMISYMMSSNDSRGVLLFILAVNYAITKAFSNKSEYIGDKEWLERNAPGLYEFYKDYDWVSVKNDSLGQTIISAGNYSDEGPY